MGNCCIFVTVFHRILDFKNGAGFLSGPLFLFSRPGCTSKIIMQDPRFSFSDYFRQLFLIFFPDIINRSEFLQQKIGCTFPYSLDLFQLIFKGSLASFLAMKANSKTMHFVADTAN